MPGRGVPGRAVIAADEFLSLPPFAANSFLEGNRCDENPRQSNRNVIFVNCIYKEDGCNHKLLVCWNEESASFRIKNFGKCDQPNVHQSVYDIEREVIIGNKFEHPELLK